MNDSTALIGIILPILSWIIGLAILYFIVQAAIINALKRARREAWTEEHMPEKADWLTPRQREELAAHKNR